MAKKSMIDKEQKRQALAAVVNTQKYACVTDALFVAGQEDITEISVSAGFT